MYLEEEENPGFKAKLFSNKTVSYSCYLKVKSRSYVFCSLSLARYSPECGDHGNLLHDF